jgi:hypothetical protein
MNISKLPDDVIKHVESFVDKRPPFADELLNREFKEYYTFKFETDDAYIRHKIILEGNPHCYQSRFEYSDIRIPGGFTFGLCVCVNDDETWATSYPSSLKI